MISVSSLEKSIKILSNTLTNMGYKTDVDSFRSGKGGDYYVGTCSYVEIEIHSKDDEYIGSYKFNANGYSSDSKYRYGGNSIKQMKIEFLRDFKKDLKYLD